MGHITLLLMSNVRHDMIVIIFPERFPPPPCSISNIKYPQSGLERLGAILKCMVEWSRDNYVNPHSQVEYHLLDI